MTRIVTTVFALTLCWSAVPAFACHENSTCTINGTTYICDTCAGTPTSCPLSGTDVCPGRCSISNLVCEESDDCTGGDDVCQFVGDGKQTRCFGSANHIITGTSADEIICAGDGNDSVDGAGGNDIISGGAGNDTIDGGNGNDVIEGNGGADAIDGGAGNDTVFGLALVFPPTGDGDNDLRGGGGTDNVWGAQGDDIIFGDAGDDLLVGQGGRDVIKGGANNDFMLTSYGGAVVNEVIGTLLCGEDGDDILIGNGPGHQCFDAGEDQAVSGAEKDCTYMNTPDDSDAADVATVTNCLAAVKSSTGGTILSDLPGCGCDD